MSGIKNIFKHADFVEEQVDKKTQSIIPDHNSHVGRMIEENRKFLDNASDQLKRLEINISNAKKRISILNAVQEDNVGVSALWLFERIIELKDKEVIKPLDALESDLIQRIEKNYKK